MAEDQKLLYVIVTEISGYNFNNTSAKFSVWNSVVYLEHDQTSMVKFFGDNC